MDQICGPAVVTRTGSTVESYSSRHQVQTPCGWGLRISPCNYALVLTEE